MKKTLVFVLVFMLAFTGCTKFRETINGSHNQFDINQSGKNQQEETQLDEQQPLDPEASATATSDASASDAAPVNNKESWSEWTSRQWNENSKKWIVGTVVAVAAAVVIYRKLWPNDNWIRETAERAEYIDDWCDRWEANYLAHHPAASHRQVIKAFEEKIKSRENDNRLPAWARERALKNCENKLELENKFPAFGNVKHTVEVRNGNRLCFSEERAAQLDVSCKNWINNYKIDHIFDSDDQIIAALGVKLNLAV